MASENISKILNWSIIIFTVIFLLCGVLIKPVEKDVVINEMNDDITIPLSNTEASRSAENDLFENSDIAYTYLENKLVVIAPKRTIKKQQITVTGNVTELATGRPLPGVNVIIEGTSLGTTTDKDGNYSLNVPDENAVLIFSFIGYNTEKETIGSRSVIDIALIHDIQHLNEVIVIGYGNQIKRVPS